MNEHRRPVARGLGVLAVLLAIAATVLVGATRSRGDAAAPPSSVWLTVSQTDGLVDGQRIFVNVKVDDDVALNGVLVRQCKAGEAYADRVDLLYFKGKCPLSGVSSSSDIEALVSLTGALSKAKTDAGLEIPFRVGTGTTDWPINSSTKGVITCDPTTSCALVVQYIIGADYYFSVVDLTFVDSDVVAACGGTDPGILQTAGSDELIETWARWTRSFCATGKAAGSPSVGTFGGGEGPAVSGFSSGLNDIAYTAAGYDPEVALQAAGVGQRSAVFVPVALNASVMATGSGRIDYVDGQSTGKTKFDLLRLKPQDAAALTTGGLPLVGTSAVYGSSIRESNPNLGDDLYYGIGSANSVFGQSTALSSTYFWTKYLSAYAPGDFVVPLTDPVQARPPTNSFATANPPYSGVLTLLTGRPPLSKTMDAARLDQSAGGPIWTITDRATARALDLGDVAIPNGAGEYVAATDDSMRAALATMKRDAQGILVPDIEGNLAAGSDVTAKAEAAYPLTYVIYAMVPAEPLYDEACKPRTGSQKILTDWLTYITTDGQAELAPGLVALPDDLKAEAQAQIAKVGKAAVTGSCATTTAAPSSGGAPGATPPVVAIPRTVTAPRVGGVTVPAGAAASAAAAAAGTTTEELAAVPVFSRRMTTDSTGGIVALVGIALVTSLGVYLTARAFSGGTPGGEGGFVDVSDRRSVFALVGLWAVIGLAGIALVVYQLGPLLQQRDQKVLLTDYAQELKAAAFATQGLPQAGENADRPPEIGDPVGILAINDIASQNVVVEGVTAAETDDAPGHVPGTAGLGQPGNSVVIGRRNAFGGPFKQIESLKKGDAIVATTTQGQSVYKVVSVREQEFSRSLLRASKDDRLTLVTSGSASPLNHDAATVVVAKMRDLPYEPTAQGALTKQAGRIDASNGSMASVLLALGVYAAVLVGSVFVYRRFRFPIAYVLSIAPIVAATVLLGETLARLMPSWT